LAGGAIEFLEVSLMAVVAAAMMGAGYLLPPVARGRFRRLFVPANLFHVVTWSGFVLFFLYSFATADAIPLVSVFRGADAVELSQQRGDLFKMRTGGEVVLLYLSALFIRALLPLSLVKLFVERSHWRYCLAGLFFVFTVMSLHKAMFINVLFPLFYYFTCHSSKPRRAILAITSSVLALLFLLTVLASGRQVSFDGHRVDDSWSDFFSAQYVSLSAAELLIWRAAAVPVFTATDSLVVFKQEFGGKPLMGATSTVLAAATRQERVLFEKMVFAHQWGWNDIANSNAVFFIEGFVNFGWLGVGGFSFVVGRILRWMRTSPEPAIHALWPVFCFGLFSGGLIGMLLSNGYLIIALAALWVTFDRPDRTSSSPEPEASSI